MKTDVAPDALIFLGPLNALLSRGETTYQRYMSQGKTFLYAKILKDNNDRIQQLIIDKSYLLPLDYQPDAIALLTHIDVWCVLWKTLEASKTHQLKDEFVFENEVTFPRASVESLQQLYKTIKSAEPDISATDP